MFIQFYNGEEYLFSFTISKKYHFIYRKGRTKITLQVRMT